MLIKSFLNRLFILTFLIPTLFLTGCGGGDDSSSPTNGNGSNGNGSDKAGFLASELDKLDAPSFPVPTAYDVTTDFAPGSYSGQTTRINQLEEIKSLMRPDPAGVIADESIKNRLSNVDDAAFTDASLNGQGKNIASKIDENVSGSKGDKSYSVRDAFIAMADSIEAASAAFATTASNGTAGQLGDSRRIVSKNGLEYAQIIEKGLYGACFYDQMVDDYLRPSQAGKDNAKGNNKSANSEKYDSQGTARQHAYDEAFGYFGAKGTTYPNASNTSSGDGQFIANYTFDFSDETETAFGINMADKLMKAFIAGRAALKANEGANPSEEKTVGDTYYNAARKDIKLYAEAGLAAAAFHYLNDALADDNDVDKLHHLSEALGFIYALSFNSEGRLTKDEAYDVLQELGWSSSDKTLTGIYDVNLWTVTDTQLNAAKTKLAESFTGFENVPF